jgi:outer membrane protein OmpA-like peptidoglycan-associated protein
VPEATWVLTGVTFDKGSDHVSSSKQDALDKAMEILTTHTKVRVEIEGHTDRSAELRR